MKRNSLANVDAVDVARRGVKRNAPRVKLFENRISWGACAARRGASLGLIAMLMAIAAADPADAAIAVTVDGNLSEWGVTVADNNGSTFPEGMSNPSSGTINVNGSALHYHLEDQSDTAGANGYLGPEHGGQAYDGEFMGVLLNGSSVSIAILTGQRPSNWVSLYSPGDIILETSNGTYGIEVGGVPDADGPVEEGDLGVSFQVNRYGNTLGAKDSADKSYADVSSDFMAPQADQVAGSIWEEPGWLQDPIDPPSDVQMDGQSGTRVGLANYVYTLDYHTADYSGDQHAVIELSFDAFATGIGNLNSVMWQPGCGNDLLQVDVPEAAHAPEPASLLIWGGIGICLLGALHRRRRRVSDPGNG